MKLVSPSQARQGAVAPLMAFLLIVLLAMAAFAVDMGYLVLAREQLQNAADAAALAGAYELAKFNPQYNVTKTSDRLKLQKNCAQAVKQAVRDTSGQNTAASVTLKVVLDKDIQLCYVKDPMDSASTITVLDDTGSTVWKDSDGNTVWANAVRVKVQRSSDKDGAGNANGVTDPANGDVDLFFARVLGVNTMASSAQATAALPPGTTTTNPGDLLPIAYDITKWTAFKALPTPPNLDEVSVNYLKLRSDAPSSLTAPAYEIDKTQGDGIPEMTGLYDHTKNVPGNFGLINIGDQNGSVGANDIERWIRNGATADERSAMLKDVNRTEFNPSVDNPITLDAVTGNKSGPVTDGFADIVGQTRMLPLFNKVVGNGTKATYDIVAVVPVTIISVSGSGNHIDIRLQPASLVDSSSPRGSGSSSGSGLSSAPLLIR